MIRNRQEGITNIWMLSTIGASVVVVGLTILSIWFFMLYNEQKTNVDSKINNAVIDANKVQADELEAKFTQREKEPLREFVGPEDYGLVTFNYPKTWSVFVEKDTSNGGDFIAYLNPGIIPPVTRSQQFGAKVKIENRDYDKVISSYSNLVSRGELKASTVSVNGNTGTRLEGKFSEDIVGAAVIFKIRDKTLTIQTDARVFVTNGDFSKIVTSIKINK